jgi:HlyD family secretion protein
MLIGKSIKILLQFAGIMTLVLGLLLAPIAESASASGDVQETPTTPLTVKGQLVPQTTATLGFTKGGPVENIFVQEGERVEAGETLIRIGDTRQYEAKIAASELELLNARQALNDLHENAAHDLALAKKRLAEAKKVQDSASWKVKSIKRGTSQEYIDQAYANLLLREKQVQNAKKDLRKAEKVWKDKSNFLWKFVKTHDYKLLLYNLERKIAAAEKKYSDALQKYNDYLKPVDEIDLAQAEADLAMANARVNQAERDRQTLLKGPDPDQVALAEARIQKAEAALNAARVAAADADLTTPISGQVAVVNYKEDEWIPPLQTAIVVADLSNWTLEIDDLPEDQVPDIRIGEKARVTIDALPEVTLQGKVESISQIAGEDHGDVTYTVKIGLGGSDPRMRWGMTGEASLSGE